MKYTKEQAEIYKNKYMEGYGKYNPPLSPVTIKDGYYIVESKINQNEPKKKKRTDPQAILPIKFDAGEP